MEASMKYPVYAHVGRTFRPFTLMNVGGMIANNLWYYLEAENIVTQIREHQQGAKILVINPETAEILRPQVREGLESLGLTIEVSAHVNSTIGYWLE